MIVISEGEGEVMEFVDDRVFWIVGIVRGCSLDGLVGDDIFEGSLFCGRELVVFLRVSFFGFVGGIVIVEGGGFLREES